MLKWASFQEKKVKFMLITQALAVQIEHCIAQSHLQFTQQYPMGSVLEIGGGSAFFAGKNSFFSQVIGWGFETTSNNFLTEIEAIEDFYRQHQQEQVDIELSSLVEKEIAHQLSMRDYLVTELSNISVLDLNTVNVKETEHRVQIVEDNDLQNWAHSIAAGFEVENMSEQFYGYAKTKNVTPFGIYQDNQWIAGGTIAIHDEICDLGVTSTLPAYRGKGLQKALLYKRIEYAIQSGARIASVTTEPGSISDLNVQKTGFQLAYTRIKFSCHHV